MSAAAIPSDLLAEIPEVGAPEYVGPFRRPHLRELVSSRLRSREEVVLNSSPIADAPQRPARRPTRIKIRVELGARRLIAGQVFYVRRDRGGVHVVHPRWSLMGSGRTLIEAEQDLRSEAGMVVRVFGQMSPDTLDHDARTLYHFALRVFQ